MNLALNRQAVAFAGVGVTAAAVHLTIVWILVSAPLITPELANVAAFCIAFGVSYQGHRRLTWPSDGTRRQAVGRWLAVSAGGFLLNQSLYIIGLRCFPQVHYLVQLFVVTGGVTVMTFCLGKYWAFLQR